MLGRDHTLVIVRRQCLELRGRSVMLWGRAGGRRYSALEVLFDTLQYHGSAFTPEFWTRIFDSVLLSIFDHVRAEVPPPPSSHQSKCGRFGSSLGLTVAITATPHYSLIFLMVVRPGCNFACARLAVQADRW